MEGTLSSDNPELQWVLDSLDGVRRTRYLALASSALLCYEYILTLDQELVCFWSGRWTKTRALFLANRYFPPVIMIVTLVCLFVPNLSLTLYVLLVRSSGFQDVDRMTVIHSCENTIPATVVLVLIAICIVQAIIVLRIWYLYSNSLIGRLIVLACYVLCTVGSFVILGTIWDELKPLSVSLPGFEFIGCAAPPATHLWRIYVISLVIHTILYIATTVPAVRLRQRHRSSAVMNLILKEGGVFYLVVFVSVGFTGIGAIQNTPSVSLPAIYSNFMLCISSVAVSRLMLRLQTLAAGLHLDSRWLLNNAELSRVQWRKGAHDGELIVDVNTVEVPDHPRGRRTYRHSHNPPRLLLNSSQIREVGLERDSDDMDIDKLEMGDVEVGGDRSRSPIQFAACSPEPAGVEEVSDVPGIRTTTVGLPDSWLEL